MPEEFAFALLKLFLVCGPVIGWGVLELWQLRRDRARGR
jgi:hypothetical protein